MRTHLVICLYSGSDVFSSSTSPGEPTKSADLAEPSLLVCTKWERRWKLRQKLVHLGPLDSYSIMHVKITIQMR